MGLFSKIFKPKDAKKNPEGTSHGDLTEEKAKIKPELVVIEFIPRVGIHSINFGSTREKVKEMMFSRYKELPLPTSKGPESDAYFEGCLQFFFEKDDTLSFIEGWNSPKRTLGIKILDFNTWEIGGKELFIGLKEIDHIDISLSNEDGPLFMNNIVTLWDLDEQYDHFGNWTTPKWGAIGIGDERYYQAIRDIRKGRISHVTSTDVEYTQNLLTTKEFYPFERWRQNFFPDPADPDLDGMEQYTQENCDKAKIIFDSLINQLTLLGKKADVKDKLDLFKKAVLSLNILHDNVDGLIETVEREDLCDLIDKITVASELNPKDYGDGEGIADEWRAW